jgi:hypothetical protein
MIPDTLFSKVVDRESLYDVGTYILGLDDDGLTESQKDFKRCYDLWLGLGNGFSDVVRGTYLTSLPRGLAAFERMGATNISTAGKLVLAEFETRHLPTTEDQMDQFMLDVDGRESFYQAIEKIDAEYMRSIWDSASVTEQQLIALAAGRQQPEDTEQSDTSKGL